ncbi:acyl carrier protein [Streptomyces salinarius]|uniref:acyl carrier protein n=1 Tax=Streptomyces salinarius TaxID=2762598 RepID=UPI001646E9CF|nr:phosphopantetheine-binding protein [Streptomyces salinarius]
MTTTPAAGTPTDDELLTALRDALIDLLDPADLAQVDLGALNRGTPLLSLPLDSITLVAAMSRLESTFRVFIPEQKAFGFTHVGDLADFVRERVAAKAARADR